MSDVTLDSANVLSRPATGALRADKAEAPRRASRAPAAGILFIAKLGGIFALAIGLRAWIISQPGLGHAEDLSLFVQWTRGLAEHGLAGFYQAESFCDYPPLMVLLFRGVGAAVASWAGPDPSGAELRLGIKALACLADLAIGALLLLEGRRLLGRGAALLACGLYLLNPVTLYDSAYWGQVDSIYTGLLVAALAFVGRRGWVTVGVAAGAALAAKFQAVAILPLIVFEAYRVGSWRGMRRMGLGMGLALAGIAAPFVATGNLGEALDRAYVRVVGQYHEKSKNAYNIWHLLGDPSAADVTPPAALARVVADGRDAVRVSESWLLGLTWRRISLAAFALSVAVVLSLYALRPGPIARHGAAGLLALCFFLFPTEMHERYAYPAIALLAIWAAASSRNERVYWALTILLTLNLAAVLPPAPLAPQIAAANLLVFGLILIGIVWARSAADAQAPPQDTEDTRVLPGVVEVEPVAKRRGAPLILAFQSATAIALLMTIGLAGWVFARHRAAPPPETDPQTVWLSDLNPTSATQGWKSLAADRSVSGGLLRLGDTIYVRGVGTHAPARLTYDVPADCDAFEAVVGVDFAAGAGGSAILHVEVDGERVFTAPTLTGRSEPLPIRIPLQRARVISLCLDNAGDGARRDHFDFAEARFIRTARPPVAAAAGRVTQDASAAPH